MLTAIPLTPSQAEEIDRLLASGACTDASEVVAAGLEALAAQEAGQAATIEDWMRRDVVPVAEALAADPSSALSPEQVRAAIHEHRAAWERGAAR
jgi:Arc/MetJ-type ribon-helix-helix transcriptional regulator